jgi:hypothetical protein
MPKPPPPKYLIEHNKFSSFHPIEHHSTITWGVWSVVKPVKNRQRAFIMNWYCWRMYVVVEAKNLVGNLFREWGKWMCSFRSFFILQWLWSPLLGRGLCFSFVIFLTQTIWLLGRVISQTEGRYLHTGPHTQISMHWVAFEPTIPVFERGN